MWHRAIVSRRGAHVGNARCQISVNCRAERAPTAANRGQPRAEPAPNRGRPPLPLRQLDRAGNEALEAEPRRLGRHRQQRGVG